MASIACGGHIGDVSSMTVAVNLAQSHDVLIGAHPSYPDSEHFGRRSIDISINALEFHLSSQINQLQQICEHNQTQISYIKPHGALYHDLTHNSGIALLLVQLSNHFRCQLMVMASTSNQRLFERLRPKNGVIFEAFADRSYTDEGTLVPRAFSHSVHSSPYASQAQSLLIAHEHRVISENGKSVPIEAQSLCVHSDTPNAVETLQIIRNALHSGSRQPTSVSEKHS